MRCLTEEERGLVAGGALEGRGLAKGRDLVEGGASLQVEILLGEKGSLGRNSKKVKAVL